MRHWIMASALLASGLSVSASANDQPIAVDCDAPVARTRVGRFLRPNTITQALERVNSGDTIEVRGTCVENLVIRERVRIVAKDGASIIGADPDQVTIAIVGNGVEISGFSLEGPASTHIGIERSASAVIDGNTIRNARERGIVVAGNSFAIISSNIIERNGLSGVLVTESSSARIGFQRLDDEVTAPNRISGHANEEIFVVSNSNADVRGNQIANGRNGVTVVSGGRATIAGNTFGALEVGVVVATNATVTLPLPNDGSPLTAAANVVDQPVNIGLFCSGGSVLGSLGPLTGIVGQVAPGALGGPVPPTGTFCEDMSTP